MKKKSGCKIKQGTGRSDGHPSLQYRQRLFVCCNTFIHFNQDGVCCFLGPIEKVPLGPHAPHNVVTVCGQQGDPYTSLRGPTHKCVVCVVLDTVADFNMHNCE